jgi:hypothetical protein
LLFFAIANFGTLQLLTTWGLDSNVYLWMTRVVWTLFAGNFAVELFCCGDLTFFKNIVAAFWLLWEVLKRIIIMRYPDELFFSTTFINVLCRIQHDKLWDRLAFLVWRENMLQQLLRAAMARKKSMLLEQVVKSSSFGQGAFRKDDFSSLEEYEFLKGKILADNTIVVDAPGILLAPSAREERQVRICRLAVNASGKIFTSFDKDHSHSISVEELAQYLGEEGAYEHLSLWDTKDDGVIDRSEMIEVMLSIFTDREEIVRQLEANSPLGHVLGVALGAIIGFIALVVILEIYTISISDLLLPLLGILLPLTFIFGASVKRNCVICVLRFIFDLFIAKL